MFMIRVDVPSAPRPLRRGAEVEGQKPSDGLRGVREVGEVASFFELRGVGGALEDRRQSTRSGPVGGFFSSLILLYGTPDQGQRETKAGWMVSAVSIAAFWGAVISERSEPDGGELTRELLDPRIEVTLEGN